MASAKITLIARNPETGDCVVAYENGTTAVYAEHIVLSMVEHGEVQDYGVVAAKIEENAAALGINSDFQWTTIARDAILFLGQSGDELEWHVPLRFTKE